MHKQISSTESAKICENSGKNSTNDEKEQKGEIASIGCQPRRQTATQTLVIQSFSLLSSSARLAAVLLMFVGIVGTGGMIIGAEAAAHPLIGLANAPDTTSLRLCGLKLTMTLNTICKNQLCGGFMFEPPKKRNYPIEELLADDAPRSLLSLVGQNTLADNGYYLKSQDENDRSGDVAAVILTDGEQQQQPITVDDDDSEEEEEDELFIEDMGYPMFPVWTRRYPVLEGGIKGLEEFIKKQKNKGKAGGKRRNKMMKRAGIGGIATECCLKRCTLAYLKTYCCSSFNVPVGGGNKEEGRAVQYEREPEQ